MPAAIPRLVFLALALGCLGACTGPRAEVRSALFEGSFEGALAAYDRFAAVEGHDEVVLGDVARLMLQTEVLEEAERARAAVLQLRLAGRPGLAALRRAAARGADRPGRVFALKALSDSNDEAARSQLAEYIDSEDAGHVALALSALDARDDEGRLLEALRSEVPALRRAAALRFGDGTNVGALDALRIAARTDGDPRVREGAVRALGAFGVDATDAIVERLSDADGGVRLAATRALLRGDAAQARLLLPSWLASPPSRASIEAARVALLRSRQALRTRAPESSEDLEAEAPFLDAPMRNAARSHLLAALSAAEDALRMQAAIAFVSLPGFSREDVRARLGVEEAPLLRFQLARALEDSDRAQGRAVMRQLLEGEASMARLQAAATLAEDDEEEALRVLEDTLAGEGPSVFRQVAARALGRRGERYAELRPLLEDRDPLVRIQAAGALAAAASRR